MLVSKWLFGSMLALTSVLTAVGVRAFAEPTASISARQDDDEDAAKEVLVRKILVASGSETLMRKSIEGMLEGFRGMPGLPEGFIEEFKSRVDYQALTDLTVPIWKKHYEITTLKAALSFYESEEGVKLVAQQPDVVTESQKVGMEWGRKLGESVAKDLLKKKK